MSIGNSNVCGISNPYLSISQYVIMKCLTAIVLEAALRYREQLLTERKSTVSARLGFGYSRSLAAALWHPVQVTL